MYGSNGRQAIDAMATQADAELGIGNIDAARDGYAKVMGNAQKIFADQRTLMSQLQLGYARALHAAGDNAAASELLNQALEADLAAFGENSLPVANDRLQMAASQCDEARRTAVAAQATIVALLGSQHRRARDAAELIDITRVGSRERAKRWNVGMSNARRRHIRRRNRHPPSSDDADPSASRAVSCDWHTQPSSQSRVCSPK